MKHHFATDHVSNTKYQQPVGLKELRQKMNWAMHHPGLFASDQTLTSDRRLLTLTGKNVRP